ncbi:MAG: hypothetical protein AAFR47_17520, partial [Pseudomonadota bacterium]
SVLQTTGESLGEPSENPSDGSSTTSIGTRGRIQARPIEDHIWLRTVFPKDYACARELRGQLSAIAVDLAYVCDVVDSLCRSGNLDESGSRSLRRRATEMMARAMEMAFEGHEDEAKKLLEHVRRHITTLRDSKNRMRYVAANLFALLGLLAIWAALRFYGYGEDLVILGENGEVQCHVFDVLALGAVGSFFAVSASIENVRVNHSVSWPEMLYAGAVRVPIGVIAAAVVILLISGGWLMGSIRSEDLPWTYLLFGFLAGFSELFVPNALKQVEGASSAELPAAMGTTRG